MAVPVAGHVRLRGLVPNQVVAVGRNLTDRAFARQTRQDLDLGQAVQGVIGETPDHAPAIELYDTDFTIDPKTYAFSCLLCMPVK